VSTPRIDQLFDLSGRVAVVTGGAGLLGGKHLAILSDAGATAISMDLVDASGHPSVVADITDAASVTAAETEIVERFGPVDILVNNAARNPKMEESDKAPWSRFESYAPDIWNMDIAVGLTGAFLACQTFGTSMAEREGGVILNVCSDLAVIAPDQRIYRQPGRAEGDQPVKPVSYSVVKHGLLGLTRYLATYWASAGVRVNAISPGGVENGQDPEFVERLSSLIPLGRMAGPDEYEGAVLFCCSDASSYMTGHNLVVDGGRTCW
jgi:NAD(P)-dependent dehydrogenase (short-subunit alcohol dehydrogenase family)